MSTESRSDSGVRAGPASSSGIIDVHAHFSDASALAQMSQRAPGAVPTVECRDDEWVWRPPGGGPEAPIERGCFDLDQRIRDMDKQGIQYQALAAWTSLYLYDVDGTTAADLLAIHNDAIVGTVRRYPTRFVGLGGLPLQSPALAVQEAGRLGAISEIVGVQIATNVLGRNLDDTSLEPVWEALESHDLPVLVHPYGPGNLSWERLSKYHLSNLIGNPLESAIAMGSLVFSGVMERHPRLKFGFVHGGGHVPYQIGRWDHGWKVRPEARQVLQRPPSEYVAKCFFDQLTHEPRAVAYLAERFGWEQVLVGTDYPWDMSTDSPLEELIAAGLPPDDIPQVGSVNARRFLRWPTPIVSDREQGVKN